MTDDEEEYSLAIPFVACVSKGGPYDDNSFAAGFEAGFIDAKLQAVVSIGASFARTVRKDLVKQLDLIAAHFNYVTKDITEEPDDEWVLLFFEPTCVCATTIEELDED